MRTFWNWRSSKLDSTSIPASGVLATGKSLYLSVVLFFSSAALLSSLSETNLYFVRLLSHYHLGSFSQHSHIQVSLCIYLSRYGVDMYSLGAFPRKIWKYPWLTLIRELIHAQQAPGLAQCLLCTQQWLSTMSGGISSWGVKWGAWSKIPVGEATQGSTL